MQQQDKIRLLLINMLLEPSTFIRFTEPFITYILLKKKRSNLEGSVYTLEHKKEILESDYILDKTFTDKLRIPAIDERGCKILNDRASFDINYKKYQIKFDEWFLTESVKELVLAITDEIIESENLEFDYDE